MAGPALIPDFFARTGVLPGGRLGRGDKKPESQDKKTKYHEALAFHGG
jgi:hypothetical protein